MICHKICDGNLKLMKHSISPVNPLNKQLSGLTKSAINIQDHLQSINTMQLTV